MEILYITREVEFSMHPIRMSYRVHIFVELRILVRLQIPPLAENITLTHLLALVTINDIRLSCLKVIEFHQGRLYQVLHFFNGGIPINTFLCLWVSYICRTGLHTHRHRFMMYLFCNLCSVSLLSLSSFPKSHQNGVFDFLNIEGL